MRYGKMVKGTFLERPNRFIAKVELDGTVYDGSLRRRLYDMKKVMDE